MNWIFFASVIVLIFFYGKCRQWMMNASKAANTAKIRYDESHTLYLDGRPYIDGTPLHSLREGMDREPVLSGMRDSGRIEGCRLPAVHRC